MNLKEIAAIAGKSGLFKVLKPTRTGVILESIDHQKAKIVANSNTRVSILSEISMYTTGAEPSKSLEEIFKSVYKKYQLSLPVNPKSDAADLGTFLESVLPDYDKEKVYTSDIKKLVTWYGILAESYPELLETKEEKVEVASVEDPKGQTESHVEEEVATKETKKKTKSPASKTTKKSEAKKEK